MKGDIFAFWVDHKVAIPGAERAVAACDFEILQSGYFHCESDSAAVAVCVI